MQRRTFLLKTAGLATLSFTGIPSAWANDAADTPRVLYALLRGGMDGLTAAPPIGDRDYDQIRHRCNSAQTPSLAALQMRLRACAVRRLEGALLAP